MRPSQEAYAPWQDKTTPTQQRRCRNLRPNLVLAVRKLQDHGGDSRMVICVHLSAEKNVAQIKRGGIKAMPLRGGGKGVFCMPLLPNFYASHQWLREIRRGQRGHATIVAIDFRLPSDEPVLVGHYAAPHVETTISAAAGIIMEAADPMGYEIVLPRSVTRDEIHKIRLVNQVIGWRYHPKSKGTKPFCPCNFCIGGEYGAGKLRERMNEHRNTKSPEETDK